MGRYRITQGLLGMGALLVVASVPVEAQSVEAIMRARERLELDEQQVEQLDQIRREAVAQRNAEMAQIAELRSQLQAGQIRRSELMAAQEDQQEARRARAEERRAGIDAILTEAQRETLQQMRRRVDRAGPEIGRGRVGRFAPRVGPRDRPGFPRGPRRRLPSGGA